MDKPSSPEARALKERVIDAKPLGKIKGGALLAVRLERVHTNWGSYPASTSCKWIARKKGSGKRTAEFAGGGAGFGAIVGALAGGGKGAAIGAFREEQQAARLPAISRSFCRQKPCSPFTWNTRCTLPAELKACV